MAVTAAGIRRVTEAATGGTDRAGRPALVMTKKGQARMYRQRCHARTGRDRGAAAVEFALVLPLLLLIIFATIDFGRAINAQITLTQAAREGARLAALGQPDSTVVTRTQGAATGLSPVTVSVTACLPGAGPAADAVVAVSYPFSFVTPVGAIASLFYGGGPGGPLTLTAQGVMPCET